MYNKKHFIRAVLTTFCITSAIWVIPTFMLREQSKQKDKEIVKLKEDVSLVSDKELLEVAKEVKNSEYSYEEYILGYSDILYEMELLVNEKDNTISLLNKKIDRIKKSYTNKLKNSQLKKYNLKSRKLTKKQLERADTIAYYVSQNYEDYGVLPSVAVGQAMQETTMGTADTSATSSYGWWGVISTGSGYEKYDSLESGIDSYLKCINNGRYNEALFNDSYTSSLLAIQNGGYCQPSNGYASKVSKCIEQFGFREYDKYYLGVD